MVDAGKLRASRLLLEVATLKWDETAAIFGRIAATAKSSSITISLAARLAF
jgi:hypothetical protein